jgi:hypothetical protein
MYTRLVDFKEEDFVARIAHTDQETCQLIEAGFEFVYGFDVNKFLENASKPGVKSKP